MTILNDLETSFMIDTIRGLAVLRVISPKKAKKGLKKMLPLYKWDKVADKAEVVVTEYKTQEELNSIDHSFLIDEIILFFGITADTPFYSGRIGELFILTTDEEAIIKAGKFVRGEL